MPLIVFFIIGVFCAAIDVHESFFWCVVALAVIYLILDLWLGIKKEMRIIKEDKEIAERTGEVYKPEPIEFHMGFLEWFTIIFSIGILIFILCTGN